MLKSAWHSLTNALGLETRATISAPDSALRALFAGANLPSISGVSIGPQNAMRSPAVRRAVGAIAETVGTLPCLTYEIDASGARKPAAGHPAHALLSRDANGWTPAPRILEQVVRDSLLWGNGYLWINRDPGGTPRELTRLKPESVQVAYDLLTSEPTYTWIEQEQRAIPREDLIHLMAPSLDGIVGESPVTACKESIALNIVIAEHVARLFSKGAKPSGILRFPAALGDKSLAKIIASWTAAHSGQNSGGIAIVEEAGEFQPLTLTSADAQTLELWTFSVLEIARAFGVPPHLLFELGRATWGNAAEMGEAFLRFGLSRWLVALEGELALKLIRPEERDRYEIQFDTDLLLRADFSKRAAAYAQLRAAGVVTANEVRAWENMPAHADGDKLSSPHITTPTPSKKEGNDNADG